MTKTICLAAAALLAACMAPSPSRADDARKIDFSSVMVDQDDRPLTECQRTDPPNPAPGLPGRCVEEAPLTLGRVCLRALSVREEALTTVGQALRGDLALRVYRAKEPVAIDASETASIILALGKSGYGPIVVLQAVRLLDPAAIKK